MPAQPLTAAEYRQRLVARVVATSPLTDLAEGDVLGSILGAVADELSMLDVKAYTFSLSHGFDENVGGSDLDDRCAQLPLQFPLRRGQQAAQGGGIYLVRAATGSSLTIPAGQLEIGRDDQPHLEYATLSDITFDVGQSVYPGVGDDPVDLVCKTPGAIGNAPPGALNIVLSYTDVIIAAQNTTGVSGGTDGETDDALRRRAFLWLSSLARSQPSALESIALDFPSTTDQYILYASLIEDPTRPGYSKLVVDDGFGMVGYTQNAAPRTGTIPTLSSGQRYTLTFDFPAVQAPILKITRGAATTTYLPGPNAEWLAIEERGILWTDPVLSALDIEPGDTWEISGHQVYNGIIAQLQAEIEANARAAGTRVQVVPARPVYAVISGNIVALPGYDLNDLNDLIIRTKRAIVAFMTQIPIGKPLYMHRLHAALQGSVQGLDNIVFDQGDKYPGDPMNRIATLVGLITLR